MAINPNNPRHLTRLQQSITHARDSLQPWRNHRTKFIREFAGTNYSDETPVYHKPVNLINQTAETYTISLVANRPRVSVSTKYRDLRFFAKKFGLHLNQLIEEIRLEETLRSVVLDAFFCIGIAKVYLGSTGEKVEIPADVLEGADAVHGNPLNPMVESVWVDPGAPMVERISFDDWFHDTTALRWDQCKFMGNYFRITFDKLKDAMFDQSVARKLKPTQRYDGHSDDAGNRASQISGSHQDYDEVMDFIDLEDVWLPYEKLIVTLPRGGNNFEKPLAVREWDGPETGPYHILGFQEVPDNLMPSSPAQNIYHLEQLYNGLLRKLERQAKRQKKVTSAPSDAKEQLEALRKSRDGEAFIYTNQPGLIQEANHGGIDQVNLAFAMQVSEWFNKAAGNPEALAGLGPQSGTATQDQMILDSVSRKFAKMSEQVVDFTTRICKDLGWLLWVDAYKRQPGQFEIPGAGITLQQDWTPDEREGDFLQYLFRVEPYSMQYRSPQQKAQQMDGILQRIILPALPMIQQQGGQLDWQALMKAMSDAYDLPELEDILRFNAPPVEPEIGPEEAMKDPAKAMGMPREYVRRNVSTGGTQQARDNVMMQTLLAGDNAPVNQQQMAGM